MSEASERFAQELRSRIDNSKAAGMTATYQFAMSDLPDSEVYARITDGQIDVGEGLAPEPDITLTATGDDWNSILHGELSGQMAFLTGKLRIRGDMALAMKLQSIFRFA